LLIDPFGRKITYLRVSVTDRCNFRCKYCYSIKKWKKLKHEEILRFEEFLKVIEAGVNLGIKKVRITGGEPLIRKGLPFFIQKLTEIKGLEDIGLTTNGFFLPELAKDLKLAGLKRINISLDTLKEEKFAWLTGVNALNRVLQGIEEALKQEFNPVKLNVVIIKGFNDDEVESLVRFGGKLGLEVRFIEFMPVGENSFWNEEHVITAEEVKKVLKKTGTLRKKDIKVETKGPAEIYIWESQKDSVKAKVGFISPLSNPFCQACNRLRLTADGKIRPCLFSNFEINLKPVLREGKGSLEEVYLKATANKPEKISFSLPLNRFMRGIGG